jgi:hypothetical protein
MAIREWIHPVLWKIFVREYYRQNLGFLSLILFFGIGILPLRSHFDLAEIAAGNPLFFMALYGTLWILYALKVQVFLLKAWKKPENELCFHLACFRLKSILRQLVLVQMAMMMPVLSYALFVGKVLLSTQNFATPFLAFLLLASLLIIPVFQIQRLVYQPNISQNSTWGNFKIAWPRNGFASFLYIRWLFWDGKWMLLLLKISSLFVVWGVCQLFYTDQYDERLLSLGLLISASLHASISYFWQRTDFLQNLWMRNLPISQPKRFFQLALVFVLISLPEMLLLAKNLPDEISFSYLPGAWIFFLGILAFGFHYQYFKPLHPEEPQKAILSSFFMLAIIIMYRIPVLIPGLILGLIAAFFFTKYYFKAEWKLEEAEIFEVGPF